MENIEITTKTVTKQAKKVKNWSASESDELHGFWLKYLTSLHKHLAIEFNKYLQKAITADWMTAG